MHAQPGGTASLSLPVSLSNRMLYSFSRETESHLASGCQSGDPTRDIAFHDTGIAHVLYGHASNDILWSPTGDSLGKKVLACT